MSANACFSIRNKIKPKKKTKKKWSDSHGKKRKEKREQEQHFSVALSSLFFFFLIIIARLRREETGFYSSYAGSTTKWRQKFRSNIPYACLRIFCSFDRILSMFVDFSTFRSLVDFFMLRRIECFQEKAIF